MKIKFALAKLIHFQTVLTLVLAATAFSQTDAPFSINESPLPAPTGAVNDYAGVIDPATKQQLEDKLKQFKETTGVELAVAVVKTTADRPIFDYSLAVARGWKIGSKEQDNPSALLLVAIDDRKYFTQVSKDLEDELPDGVVGSLQRQYLVPEFRKGNYAKGISDTVDAYIRKTEERRSGGPVPAANTEQPPANDGPGASQIFSSSFCCLLIIGVILLIIFSNRGGKKRKGGDDDWGGGFGGGGSALPWIVGSILTSGSGGSSSSSSWGGGSSGGGSDWGGFGGGGDFGGGGAGGDW